MAHAGEGAIATLGRSKRLTSDRDIYAVALQLIRKHGAEGAGFHAAQRADEMLAQGAHTGMRVWQRIMRAIDDLAAKEPPPGAVTH